MLTISILSPSSPCSVSLCFLCLTPVSCPFPQLKGKLNGIALRVPTPNVSVVDLVINVEKKGLTAEDVNDAFRKAAEGPQKVRKMTGQGMRLHNRTEEEMIRQWSWQTEELQIIGHRLVHNVRSIFRVTDVDDQKVHMQCELKQHQVEPTLGAGSIVA